MRGAMHAVCQHITLHHEQAVHLQTMFHVYIFCVLQTAALKRLAQIALFYRFKLDIIYDWYAHYPKFLP